MTHFRISSMAPSYSMRIHVNIHLQHMQVSAALILVWTNFKMLKTDPSRLTKCRVMETEGLKRGGSTQNRRLKEEVDRRVNRAIFGHYKGVLMAVPLLLPCAVIFEAMTSGGDEGNKGQSDGIFCFAKVATEGENTAAMTFINTRMVSRGMTLFQDGLIRKINSKINFRQDYCKP